MLFLSLGNQATPGCGASEQNLISEIANKTHKFEEQDSKTLQKWRLLVVWVLKQEGEKLPYSLSVWRWMADDFKLMHLPAAVHPYKRHKNWRENMSTAI